MIFFSVILPTYNRASLIVETIQTVLQQTYSYFEVIVVDDGSTDDTKNIIESNYSNETRVRCFFKQNEERGAARNFGLKQALGDYAIFFDSDDWMKPDYLDTLRNIIDDHPGIFLLAAKYNYDKEGKEEMHPSLHKLAEGWYGQELLLEGNILACNFCIRIKDHPYKYFPEERDLATMEDWLFLLLNLENEKVFIKDKICVTMRQHAERSMMNNQKVIKARQNATFWILKNIDLDNKEGKKLLAWSHYFCGIHQYLDQKRTESVKEALASVKIGGMNRKFLLLLIKSIVGRKIILAIK